MEQILLYLNSPIAITAVAALALFGLNRLYSKQPLWKKYEGTIVAAIKFAEKKIPDDTENKSLAKLDDALEYVLAVYAKVNAKRPSAKIEHELREGITLTHEVLEKRGSLRKGN